MSKNYLNWSQSKYGPKTVTRIGEYRIQEQQGSFFCIFWEPGEHQMPDERIPCNSLKHGKQLAQEHFNEHIVNK